MLNLIKYRRDVVGLCSVLDHSRLRLWNNKDLSLVLYHRSDQTELIQHYHIGGRGKFSVGRKRLASIWTWKPEIC